MESEDTREEHKLSISIKQTAKGFAYYEVKAKGNTQEEIDEKITKMIELAERKTMELNKGKEVKE